MSHNTPTHTKHKDRFYSIIITKSIFGTPSTPRGLSTEQMWPSVTPPQTHTLHSTATDRRQSSSGGEEGEAAASPGAVLDAIHN